MTAARALKRPAARRLVRSNVSAIIRPAKRLAASHVGRCDLSDVSPPDETSEFTRSCDRGQDLAGARPIGETRGGERRYLSECSPMKDFTQFTWGPTLEDDCRQLVRLAVREDLDQGYDWTTVALIPEAGVGRARLVARQAGVAAGLSCVPIVLDEMDTSLQWQPAHRDGDLLERDECLGVISGSARDLLTSERIILNLLGRLSGIATLTRQFVDRVAGTRAAIYDTRKTCPGYRRLDKYSVHCGGGRNHRSGLYDAVLIKDNHLAFGRSDASQPFGLTEAIEQTRQFLANTLPADRLESIILEVEVDTLEQLTEVLPSQPDIILLDNMTGEQLSRAVAVRDASGSATQLEASGGVRLDTVRAIAETGVERISVGSLTHSAPTLDIALDWIFRTIG
jgi:nicotinate-nucleotide pyrophosphorylase (carboxylating)